MLNLGVSEQLLEGLVWGDWFTRVILVGGIEVNYGIIVPAPMLRPTSHSFQPAQIGNRQSQCGTARRSPRPPQLRLPPG